MEKSRRISTYGPRLSFYIPLSRYSHNQGCGNPNPFSHFQPPLKLRGSWPACRANLKPQPRSEEDCEVDAFLEHSRASIEIKVSVAESVGQ